MVKRANPDGLFNEPSHRVSAQVSMICLATTNPAKADEEFGIIPQYNNTYRCEPTCTYHVHDNPTASTLWPQIQLYGALMVGTAAGGATPAAITSFKMPAKIPINQFVQIYQNQTTARIIRSYKNPFPGPTATIVPAPANPVTGGAYWSYKYYDSDGNDFFTVGVGNDINLAFRFKPGVGKFEKFASAGNPGTVANLATHEAGAGTGLFQSLVAGDVATVQALMAANQPRDGPTNLTSSFTYGPSSSERIYMYQDSPAVGGVADYAQGTTQTTAGLIPTPTVSQAGVRLTGSTIFYFAQVPFAPVDDFLYSIAQYSYNEQQEYLSVFVSGTVDAAHVLANTSFAALSCVEDDYNRWELTSLWDDSDDNPTTLQIGIVYVGCGEGWSHIPTFQIDTMLDQIDGTGWIATAGKISNTTAEQYRAGLQAGVQPSNKTEWQSIVDGGDPFSNVTQVLRAKALSFKEGGYAWLRPTDDSDYAIRQEIITASSLAGVTGAAATQTMRCRLDDQPFVVHVLQNNTVVGGTVPPQDFLMDLHETGEFTTNSQWRHPVYSMWSQDAWKASAEQLKYLPQLMPNASHDLITAIGSGLHRLGVSPATIGTIKTWYERLKPVGKAIGDVLLAAL